MSFSSVRLMLAWWLRGWAIGDGGGGCAQCIRIKMFDSVSAQYTVCAQCIRTESQKSRGTRDRIPTPAPVENTHPLLYVERFRNHPKLIIGKGILAPNLLFLGIHSVVVEWDGISIRFGPVNIPSGFSQVFKQREDGTHKSRRVPNFRAEVSKFVFDKRANNELSPKTPKPETHPPKKRTYGTSRSPLTS